MIRKIENQKKAHKQKLIEVGPDSAPQTEDQYLILNKNAYLSAPTSPLKPKPWVMRKDAYNERA